VHWLNSHEVTGTIGQASTASIILRGLPSQGRDVVLFCSHAEIQLQPSKLHLSAAAQVEVKLQFKPSSTGLRNVVMNVVDSMTGSLVDVILIRTNSRVGHVSRVFEIDLPIGTVINKKVRF
jgi:nephrocystin-4